MVVTARSRTAPTGSMQERTGLPSICTVQAPHWAMPQPNFVPVMPSMSRRTQSNGMSVGPSNDFDSPLTVNVTMRDPIFSKDVGQTLRLRNSPGRLVCDEFSPKCD